MNLIIEETINNVVLNIDETNENVIIDISEIIENTIIEVSEIGLKGDKGDKGDSGVDGVDGKSAYQSAIDGGFIGTELEFNTFLSEIDNKVDKVSGYSLTKNDLTDILKSAYDSSVSWITTNGSNLISHITNYSNPHQTTASQVGSYTTSQVDIIANTKVDKITGKGLSTNDYTTTEQTKLVGIQSGAEVNINADWNATSGDALILNKPTIPSLSGYVPYTGATSDINLGEFGIQLGNLEFDLTPTNAPTGVGSMLWNDSDGTLDLKLKGGNVTLQIGQEQVTRVVNKTDANLLESEYKVVYISGAQGNRLKCALALANNDALSNATLGLVTENITLNQEGFITSNGLIRGVNTTGSLQGETWIDGDILYLSPTILGGITNIKPIAPNHLVMVGYVVNSNPSVGSIYVKVQIGFGITELHDVLATTPNNNEVLTYESSTTLWKPKTVVSALGYTPYNATNPNGYTSNLGTVTNVSALTLGTSGNDLSSSIANGTTTPTITLNIPTASATNRGVLSSTDWSTFNGKANDSDVVHLSLTEIITGQKRFNPTVSASSAIARGTYLTPTLTATANNDVLVGLDIAPTFNSGGFTGVKNYWLQLNGNVAINGTNQMNLLRGGSYVFSSSTVETNVSSVSASASLKFSLNSNSLNIGQFSPTTGNLVLQNGGTFVDDGVNRLQVNGSVKATGYKITSGTSTQFLKADGSVDSSTYQGAITLTTIGTSGAATLVGSTLNIPQYSGGGGGSSLVITNRQTASYTLVLTDLSKLIEMNVATANNLTVPLNSSVAFDIGTEINVVQYGAGQTTIVATSGVTIRSANAWLKLNAQYGAATLTKIGTDEWYLWGNLNA